jgi:hypothetical protein
MLATELRVPDYSDSLQCARRLNPALSDGETARLKIPSVSRPDARAAIAAAIALVLIAGAAQAQVPAPPPGPPPLTRPSVPILPGNPSQLISVPGVVATPLLTPVPIPTASPTPVPRVFNCSCYTTASGTEWSGTVTASDYAAARSAASGACVRYLTSVPQSPYIVPGRSPGLGIGNAAAPEAQSSAAAAGAVPGQTMPNSPANELRNSPSLTGASFCNVCACD